MDGVINRLRNTVTSVLPGNPVSREFEMREQIASSGPGLMWKLYSSSKKSSKEPATVWLLEKRMLDNFSKSQKETILEKFRQGVLALTRLRHPRILSVVHPLEESRESLGFATEPIFTSLANALGQKTNMNSSALTKLGEFKFTDTEMKYGMLQICEALLFIHKDGNQLHLNVAPESITINQLGSWKLCGFEFACAFSSQEGDDGVRIPSWQSSIPPLCQPQLDFCAPEVVIDGSAHTASDMFSVGMLLYALYNEGQSFLGCNESYGQYRKAVGGLKHIKPGKLSNIPENLRDFIKMLLHNDVNFRPDAHELLKISYFEDPNVISLKNLDDLYQLDNLARSKFYKNLPKSINSLPLRINLHRVFPQLAEEFSNKNMIPFILPSIIQIIEMVSQEEFTTYILPKFKHVLCVKEPVQVLFILLQNLNILISKFSPADFKTYALPTLDSALEVNNLPIVNLCLQSLPDVASLMDFTILKTNILPRLKKVYTRIDDINIRLATLTCLAKIMENLERWCFRDDILPFIIKIKTREPAIMVAMLCIYRIAFSHKKLGISRDILVSTVVPNLLQLSMECNLTMHQYSAFADLIREMFARIDQEQRTKLADVHALGEDAATTCFSIPLNVSGSASSMVESMMSSLCLTEQNSSALQPSNASGLKADIFESPEPAQTINTTASSMATKPMTLEDKKRMIAESEQASRLCQQSTILPDQRKAVKNTAKPVDLTSQLINANLYAVNWNTSSGNTNRPMLDHSTPMGCFNGMPNYNMQNSFQHQSILPPSSTMYGKPSSNNFYVNNQTPALLPIMGQPSNNTPAPLSKSDLDDLLG